MLIFGVIILMGVIGIVLAAHSEKRDDTTTTTTIVDTTATDLRNQSIEALERRIGELKDEEQHCRESLKKYEELVEAKQTEFNA